MPKIKNTPNPFSQGKETIQMCIVVLFLGLLSTACQKTQKEQRMHDPEYLNVQANLVFFYYEDLAEAQRFYEDVLGLERVLDYGFASVHRISQTSYIGLVDEKEGMHRASEPKTVTLAFVTEEVDEWYLYLKEKGIKCRGPVRNATRHPTRGFVAVDPGGYFLEFEIFLDHPQNEKLLRRLKNVESIYPKENQATSRPQSLGVWANVIWLYYEELERAQHFYEDLFGLKLLVDQGFAKVYSSSPTAYIGLVDEAQGLHRFSREKAVNVSFITEKVDAWYHHLRSRELTMRVPLDNAEQGLVRAFVTLDLAGYFLEFDWFNDHEKNQKILGLLKK